MIRSAMSMIELVVAIVVMGIVVMSLPLILTQVQNNNAFAMQQEAILAAKTKIVDVLTYEWDENSYNTAAQRSYVLDTASNPGLSRVVGTTRRVGHVNAENRRKLFDTAITPTDIANLGRDGGDLDDIDDFSGGKTVITATLEGAGTLDYVFDLNMTSTVTYSIDDTTLQVFIFNPDNANAITNIKTISVQVTGANQNITLYAFTCNIGEATPLTSRPYR